MMLNGCSSFSLVKAKRFKARDSARSLMAQLNDSMTTDRNTAKQVLALARRDSEARAYVVQSLPAMIKSGADEVWLNAVWLAGELRAPETIPSLLQAMSRRPFPDQPSFSLAGLMRLEQDTVAKAISKIGDPAVPPVANLLNSSEDTTRGRAILILRNIGSSAARDALKEHLPNETKPDLKKLIEDGLRPVTPK